MRRFLVPPELAPSVALSREVKELESDLVEHKMQKSGWTRAQCVRHVQFLCPDVFEQVREDTVRRWKGE